MNEAEWLVCTDPTPMLEFLRPRANDRKLRLFACAFCRDRHIWEDWLRDERSRKAIETAERFVDGEVIEQELSVIRRVAWAPIRGGISPFSITASQLARTAWATVRDGITAAAAAVRAVRRSELAFQSSLLRDIFGNPFRPISLGAPLRTPTVISLARAAYDERQLPSGELDPHRLAVLADALEEAGAPAELVIHLRSRGPHVRGCWAVDLCLGLS
jgi:hypothetical protein